MSPACPQPNRTFGEKVVPAPADLILFGRWEECGNSKRTQGHFLSLQQKCDSNTLVLTPWIGGEMATRVTINTFSSDEKQNDLSVCFGNGEIKQQASHGRSPVSIAKCKHTHTHTHMQNQENRKSIYQNMLLVKKSAKRKNIHKPRSRKLPSFKPHSIDAIS